MRFIAEDVKSPTVWVELLKSKGVNISERKLRSLARKHKKLYMMGKTMMLHPLHIDFIIQEESKEEIGELNGK